jgi:hypothetical protein
MRMHPSHVTWDEYLGILKFSVMFCLCFYFLLKLYVALTGGG